MIIKRTVTILVFFLSMLISKSGIAYAISDLVTDRTTVLYEQSYITYTTELEKQPTLILQSVKKYSNIVIICDSRLYIKELQIECDSNFIYKADKLLAIDAVLDTKIATTTYNDSTIAVIPESYILANFTYSSFEKVLKATSTEPALNYEYSNIFVGLFYQTVAISLFFIGLVITIYMYKYKSFSSLFRALYEKLYELNVIITIYLIAPLPLGVFYLAHRYNYTNIDTAITNLINLLAPNNALTSAVLFFVIVYISITMISLLLTVSKPLYMLLQDMRIKKFKKLYLSFIGLCLILFYINISTEKTVIVQQSVNSIRHNKVVTLPYTFDIGKTELAENVIVETTSPLFINSYLYSHPKYHNIVNKVLTNTTKLSENYIITGYNLNKLADYINKWPLIYNDLQFQKDSNLWNHNSYAFVHFDKTNINTTVGTISFTCTQSHQDIHIGMKIFNASNKISTRPVFDNEVFIIPKCDRALNKEYVFAIPAYTFGKGTNIIKLYDINTFNMQKDMRILLKLDKHDLHVVRADGYVFVNKSSSDTTSNSITNYTVDDISDVNFNRTQQLLNITDIINMTRPETITLWSSEPGSYVKFL